MNRNKNKLTSQEKINRYLALIAIAIALGNVIGIVGEIILENM